MLAPGGFITAPKYRRAGLLFWLDYLELVDETGAFHLEVRNPATGLISRHTTEGVAAALMNEARQFSTPTRDSLSLEFFGDGRVALLTIPRLDDLGLQARFAEVFRQLDVRGVRTLVLDIRGNGGGYDEPRGAVCIELGQPDCRAVPCRTA